MKLNKEKGITLVALIITIIVLIILAAVSVMIITANGAERYYEKQGEEKVMIESIGDKVDSIVEVLKEKE